MQKPLLLNFFCTTFFYPFDKLSSLVSFNAPSTLLSVIADLWRKVNTKKLLQILSCTMKKKVLKSNFFNFSSILSIFSMNYQEEDFLIIYFLEFIINNVRNLYNFENIYAIHKYFKVVANFFEVIFKLAQYKTCTLENRCRCICFQKLLEVTEKQVFNKQYFWDHNSLFFRQSVSKHDDFE